MRPRQKRPRSRACCRALAEQHACVRVAHSRPARRDGRMSIPGRSADDQPGIVSSQADVVGWLARGLGEVVVEEGDEEDRV
jgi:hypothetical protein